MARILERLLHQGNSSAVGSGFAALFSSDDVVTRALGARDMIIEPDRLVVSFCLRNGPLGVIFVIFQFLPWVLKLVVGFIKFLESQVEYMMRKKRPWGHVVRRVLWIFVVSFLLNWGAVFSLQKLFNRPLLRPECTILRGQLAMPAQDPAIFFHIQLLIIWTSDRFYRVGFRITRSQRAILIGLAILNSVGLYFNGLQRLDEILAGALFGIFSAYIWAKFVIRFVSDQEE